MVDSVRVVVVDDSEDTTETLALMLEMDGYEVRAAHNGVEALRLIEEYQPHCVLIDILMPEMDGLELVKTLRKRYQDGIVLVAVTGAPSDHPNVTSTFRLVDHYFTKPVDPKRLRKVLEPVA